MALGLLLFAFLCFVGVLYLSVAPIAGQGGKVAGNSMFHVSLDVLGEMDPEKVLLLTMDSSGDLRDLTGHELLEEEFKSLLHEGQPKKPYLLRLQIRDEGKTSLAALSKTLAKLRAASDPNRETIVFLYLDELR